LAQVAQGQEFNFLARTTTTLVCLTMAKGLLMIVFSSLLATAFGKVTPIEQVVKMLEDLQTKVIIEGKAEAKTYDKFACFCKDSTDEKSAAITDGQTSVDALVAKINDRQSDRSTIDTKMSELNEQIAKLTKEMEAETKAHKANAKTYEGEDNEKLAAITGLDEAIKAIKAATDRPKGLKGYSVSMAVKKQVKNIRSSLMIADALGLGSAEAHREVAKLLQMGQTPGEVAYEENEDTSAAIGTLVSLEKDFNSQKNQNSAAEKKRVFAYDSFMQQRTDEKKLAEKNLAKQTKLHGTRSAEIAEFQQLLTETQATLRDDQAYLKDLVSKCNAKSEDWDKRTSMRSGELAAISSALNIITSKIAKKSAFLQMPKKMQMSWAQMGSIIASKDSHHTRLIAKTVETLQTPRAHLSLILKAASSHKAPDDSVREEVLDLLRTKGQELKSTMLVRIAGQMQNDPFGKIKTLISELINRLNQEAADEATHKGWCDQSIGKAQSTRENKAEAIANLNSELDMKQIAKDKLIDDIAVLTSQIEELDLTKDEFTKVREDEKAENEATIKEAEEGLAAVQDAKEVLKKFYGEDAPSSLVQRSTRLREEPDAGFEGGDGRDQEGGANIIALMDVIEGDFERTIAGTKKEEDQAVRDFKALKRTTEISTDTKTSDKEAKESELASTKDHISKKLEDLKGEQELLDKSLESSLNCNLHASTQACPTRIA
jgi:hypothetical protein